MRIGIFGGSFDPIHNGHLMLANFARHELKLHKVIFVPTYKSPKNYKTGVTSYKHRLNMLEWALNDDSEFEISDVEIKRRKISYTIDTVKYFKKRYPKDKLYLILGPDMEILNFKDCKKILKLVEIADEHYFNYPQIDIRSTLIRKIVSYNHPIKYLVPESVKDYIKLYKLYRRKK